MKLKKFLTVSVIALVLVAFSCAFIACTGNGDDETITYKVSVPTDAIGGITEISFAGGTPEGGNSYVVDEGVTFNITVSFETGYETGSFKVEAGGSELSAQTISSDEEPLRLQYGFTVNSDTTVVFTGTPARITFTVTSEYAEMTSEFTSDTFEKVQPTFRAQIVKAGSAEPEEGISSIEGLATWFGTQELTYGDKLIITTVVTGDRIAFPTPVVNGDLNIEHIAKISGKTYTTVDEITFTKAINLVFSEDTRAVMCSTTASIKTVDATPENVGSYVFRNEKWEEISALNEFYYAEKIYCMLDFGSPFGLNNEALAAAIKTDVITTMTVNGKDVPIVKTEHNGKIYAELGKPSAYDSNSADTYTIGYKNADTLIAASDLFISEDVSFKSSKMVWGDDLAAMHGEEYYGGYRYKNGLVRLGIALDSNVDSITVVINGKINVELGGIQSADNTSDSRVAVFRYYDGCEESSEYYSVYNRRGMGDILETHALVIDAAALGEAVVSVEVK